MTTNTINTAPYLRTYRKFPEDATLLAKELTRGWIETANCVNQRVIGLLSSSSPTVTGTTYYLSGPSDKQQSLQRIFTFSETNLTIDHGIAPNTYVLPIFISKSGYTDGTNSFGLAQTYPPLAGQISAEVTPTQILITQGPATPATFNGLIVLEWLCNT